MLVCCLDKALAPSREGDAVPFLTQQGRTQAKEAAGLGDFPIRGAIAWWNGPVRAG